MADDIPPAPRKEDLRQMSYRCLSKIVRQRAEKSCAPVFKVWADCTKGQTVGMAWNCRDELADLQTCFKDHQDDAHFQVVIDEWWRERHAAQAQPTDASSSTPSPSSAGRGAAASAAV